MLAFALCICICICIQFPPPAFCCLPARLLRNHHHHYAPDATLRRISFSFPFRLTDGAKDLDKRSPQIENRTEHFRWCQSVWLFFSWILGDKVRRRFDVPLDHKHHWWMDDVDGCRWDPRPPFDLSQCHLPGMRVSAPKMTCATGLS